MNISCSLMLLAYKVTVRCKWISIVVSALILFRIPVVQTLLLEYIFIVELIVN